MPYIGRGISQLQTIDKLDAITPSTSTGAGPYNLTQSSSAFTPISANNLLISINGVVQYGNFTVSGSTVTFTGALSDSDTCNFILHVGEGVVNTPGAGTVTGSSVASAFDISSKTVTLPASVSGLGTGITNAQLAGSIANAKLANSQITINGSAVSLGDSTTIATGIEWQSTIVTGSTLSATANYGYFIDTSSNACTVTLPGSASVGDELWFVDYARNFATNALTINQNSLKYQGNTSPNPVYDTNGQAIHIVYSGATKGWIPTSDDDVAFETPQAYSGVSFLVVAGGGGGGFGFTGGYYAGGGGAGGYRNSYASETSGRNASTESTISLTPGAVYTVTVGDGGAIATNGVNGSNGTNSSIVGTGVSVISLGGGFGMGGNTSAGNSAGDGGCGGGAADGVNYTSATGGSGTAGQGFDGGSVPSNDNGAAGGGGAGGAAANYSGTNMAGGIGLASSITGSSVTRAVGGGGSMASTSSKTANTGGGGDGSTNNNVDPTAGASGVVIMRIPTANYSGTTTGSPTVSTSGSDKLLIFNSSGSVTG